MPHDTSDGDDPSLGERIDDLTGVARGRRSARWRRGGFRNPGARGCGSSAAMFSLLVVSAAVGARARLRR